MVTLPAASSPVVLGFLIRDTRADTFDELLSIQPGLSVLYGLNGAGKSRTLDDIRRFWTGVACDSLALIQLPQWPSEPTNWFGETERVDWYPDWARRARVSVEDEDVVLTTWLTMCLEANEITFPGIDIAEDAVERRQALIDDWLRQRLLLVAPSGTQDDRRWVSAPAFLTGSDFPAINAEVELSDRVDEHEAWDEHGGELLLNTFGVTPDGRTIACASLYGVAALDFFQRLVTAGQHDRLLDLSPSLLELSADVDSGTRAHLAGTVSQPVASTDAGPAASGELVARIRELEKRANAHYAGVLQDAPMLRLHVAPIGFDDQVEWFVESDDANDVTTERDNRVVVSVDPWTRKRRIAELSAAQRRWAHWSIHMGLQEIERVDTAPSRLILIDEPESALHRSAETHMADYLRSIAADGSTQLLLATHSPELLDLDAARVYEVSRVRGQRRLSPLTSVARDNLDALGLLPSDLLRRQRGFILVEGLHDEVVLDVLFGAELRRLRVEPLPMRGTSELSPAKIAFLLEYTPAHVFILLDNVVTSELSETWRRAVDLLAMGRPDDAQRQLIDSTCLRTDEGVKLRKVLTEVLLQGHAARVTPFGLTQTDIIEYLPVNELVPGATDWQELRERHREARQSQRNAPRDFKAWLKRDLRADFSPESLRFALQSLDIIPPDLLRLLKTVEAHLHQGGSLPSP